MLTHLLNTYYFFIYNSDGSKSNDENDAENKDKDDQKDDNPAPRALHKTASIFLRNLAPTITKQEVEAVSTINKIRKFI